MIDPIKDDEIMGQLLWK